MAIWASKLRAARVGAFLLGVAPCGCYSGLANFPQDAQSGDASGADGADGADASGGTSEGGTGPQVDPAEAEVVVASGARRLTAREYSQTVRDLVLDETFEASSLLPADELSPFDNDYRTQVASQGLVEGAELLAEKISTDLIADPPRMQLVVGCVPTGAGDEQCMRTFISRFGRRVWRRPLSDAEVDSLLQGPNGDDGALAHAIEADDFAVGVDSLVRGFLQDPEFLYRIEIGTPVPDQPGLFALSQFEIATRMSYLIWGTTPDEELLDRAAADELLDGDSIRLAAAEMLTDPKALARVARFHAMWLAYSSLPHDAELSAALDQETTALIERVVFDERLPWQDLFAFPETYISDFLAEHYGLPLPGSDEPVWVPYGDSGRAGLFSHGTFLSVGGEGIETNPMRRGRYISERVLCQTVPPKPMLPPPPPVPPGLVCKEERLSFHSMGSCAGCHKYMDEVGFGLENYDQSGRYREFEYDNPMTEADESQCPIGGQGSLPIGGTYSGPKQMAEVMLADGSLSRCLATQLIRFHAGHAELDSVDLAAAARLTENVGDESFRFDDVVLELVGSDAFRFRREDTEVN